MNTRTLRIPLLALILVVAAFAAAPLADEGFWPYNSIPKAAIKAKYKFDVTDTWLNHLQLGDGPVRRGHRLHRVARRPGADEPPHRPFAPRSG